MIKNFLAWFFKRELDAVAKEYALGIYQRDFYEPFKRIVDTRRAGMFGPPARIFTQLVDELEAQEQKMQALTTLFWESVNLLPEGEQKQAIKRRSAFLGGPAVRHLYE